MLTAAKKMIVMFTAPALMICGFLFPIFSYFSFLFSALGSESQDFWLLGIGKSVKLQKYF